MKTYREIYENLVEEQKYELDKLKQLKQEISNNNDLSYRDKSYMLQLLSLISDSRYKIDMFITECKKCKDLL